MLLGFFFGQFPEHCCMITVVTGCFWLVVKQLLGWCGQLPGRCYKVTVVTCLLCAALQFLGCFGRFPGCCHPTVTR